MTPRKPKPACRHHRPGKWLACGVAFVLHGLWLALLLWWCQPAKWERQLEGVCQVTSRTRYAIVSGEGDSLFLSRFCPDTLTSDYVMPADSFEVCKANGFFVRGDGTLVAPACLRPLEVEGILSDSLHVILSQWLRHTRTTVDCLDRQLEEANYFVSTHSIIDDGYNAVMDLRQKLLARKEKADSLLRVLEKMQHSPSLSAKVDVAYEVLLSSHPGDAPATLLSAPVHAVGNPYRQLALWKLTDVPLPAGTYVYALTCWSPEQFWKENAPSLLLSRACFENPGSSSVWQREAYPYVADFNMPLTVDGAPVVNAFGGLSGVLVNGQLQPVQTIVRLLEQRGESFSWEWARHEWFRLSQIWRDDAVPAGYTRQPAGNAMASDANHDAFRANRFQYALLADSSRYLGEMADRQPHGKGIRLGKDGSCHVGSWARGKREGYGCLTDSVQRVYQGEWQADTLPHGTCVTMSESYEGGFHADLTFMGGMQRAQQGRVFYQGDYLHGKRHGFGISNNYGETLRAGDWKEDRFKGENMINGSHRVYGIDISGHQHKKGRKVHSIDWKHLRIVGLGLNSGGRVHGEENYPVSFVFIKSTQRDNFVNPFFAADAKSARAHGIPVGAYHFFSPMEGHKQAQHFLKHTTFAAGDLPPVLDVELSDGQIAAMGGVEAMWKEVSVWLKEVETAVGKKPILYISQSYTDRYLPQATKDILECDFWIARYNKYKPYVHLLMWQLSAKGRVCGIQGDVDIDVWNGSRLQFQEYLRSLQKKN